VTEGTAEAARTSSDCTYDEVPCIEFWSVLDVLPGTALAMLAVVAAGRESGPGLDVVLDLGVPRAFDGPVAGNDEV